MAKKPKKKRSVGAKIIRAILFVIAAIVVLALGYVAYVFLSYQRIEDKQDLEVAKTAAQEKIATEEELLVTSYNIGFGAYSDDYTFFMDGGKESWAFSKEAVYENIEGATQSVLAKKPDIALFQEVDFDATRSYHVDERQLLVNAVEEVGDYTHILAQNYDSPFLFYPFTQPHGANKSCIMTFSNARITSGLRRSLPIEEGLSKVIDLDRCYSVSRIPTDNGKELVVYNLHLSAYTAKAETAENQLRMLIEDMQSEYDAGNYCIAGGDFNRDLLGNSPEIFHTKTLEDNWAQPINLDLFTDDITLVKPFNEAVPVATCRNPDKPYEKGDFVVTVDGFIVSANVQVLDADVIDNGFAYSDHQPVWMQIKLMQ